MLLKAIGDMLPAALAVALSPFPVIAVVLVLATPQARSNGVAFALGWLAGLTGLVAIVLLVADGSDSPDGSTWVVIDWIRIAVGAAMIAVAVKKWRGRPRAG
jgi:hypothetical protein